MRRFYLLLADKLKYFPFGRLIVQHVTRHNRFYENFEALYTALILALLIKTFLFEAYKIPSSSMNDTLIEGDRIFVMKFIYAFQPIKVGDIVVFRTKGIEEIEDPLKPYYIKRVVGLPNDRIRIGRDGHIYRNGELVEDPPFFQKNRYVFLPTNSRREFVVPEGEIFVFGDNSRNSWDSRAWGGVPLENVVGKAFFRYWPPSRIGFIRGTTCYPLISHGSDDPSYAFE